MYTYQDYLQVKDDDGERMKFVMAVIEQHKNSDDYKMAEIAKQYNEHKNVTIVQYQKLLYDVTGNAVPDNWSANFKMASKFFNRFVTQENQYLLGNGATFGKKETKKKLGKKNDFDFKLQDLGEKALVAGVAFGFFNKDHLEVFELTEFAPLYDEENGALRAGVRFWQIDNSKPLRATLYEEDGYTDYIWNRRENGDKVGEILHVKRTYILKVKTSKADGEEIYGGENYPGFPILPLWGNPYHQSELVGLREEIDCYDLIKSGYANNVDEGSLIYWTLQNAGGMDDVDLAQFVEKMKTLHAATTDGMANAEPHTFEAPYASREALLNTLRSDLFDDAMALDVKAIAAGAITATQIKAGYEGLNSKTDKFEYCVTDFMDRLLTIAGLEDEVTFTRSIIVNNQEEVQLLIQAAPFLPQEYITRKLLELLGDGDKADEILKQMEEDELERQEQAMEMMAAQGGNPQGQEMSQQGISA